MGNTMANYVFMDNDGWVHGWLLQYFGIFDRNIHFTKDWYIWDRVILAHLYSRCSFTPGTYGIGCSCLHDYDECEAVHFLNMMDLKFEKDKRKFAIARSSVLQKGGTFETLVEAIDKGPVTTLASGYLDKVYRMMQMTLLRMDGVYRWIASRPEKCTGRNEVRFSADSALDGLLSDCYYYFIIRFVGADTFAKVGAESPTVRVAAAMMYASLRRIFIVIDGLPLRPVIVNCSVVSETRGLDKSQMPSVWKNLAAQFLQWREVAPLSAIQFVHDIDAPRACANSDELR
jgi:hypothetical protein